MADWRGIDLWCAFPGRIADAALLREYHGLLSETERARQRRLYFERDRHRFLVTRVLVRMVLSKYAPLEPTQWLFSANRHGRPEIANPEPGARSIVFNVSHSMDLIMLGVTRGRALGLDVEGVREQAASLGIAERFFAPDEARELHAQPAHHRQRRFFEYWTLKESYIKARGMGLSIPLDHFSFHFPGDSGIRLAMRADQQDWAARWHFWQFGLERDYLTAVCAESMPGGPPSLSVRTIVPMVSERRQDWRLLRSTEA
ncbi:4'-phosphopantetheinyl transferase family protein [Chromobacterium sphagni]|uniref:4-phosphopantetheinyl transferase n=1 Tax=Chromobacterium sphagni TaxID=1903179 RepID=A0ABX3CF00_9NEIS|nr:4'-phosphopantetheinyl transferase superfamily protein [Chromobacterium sphagni]OHX20698.1 hypothetical protein BI344_14355 [Chromobacterium sphagni]